MVSTTYCKCSLPSLESSFHDGCSTSRHYPRTGSPWITYTRFILHNFEHFRITISLPLNVPCGTHGWPMCFRRLKRWWRREVGSNEHVCRCGINSVGLYRPANVVNLISKEKTFRWMRIQWMDHCGDDEVDNYIFNQITKVSNGSKWLQKEKSIAYWVLVCGSNGDNLFRF